MMICWNPRWQPPMRASYEDADLVRCAATYAYRLTQAHAFFDGNKRVAAAVTEIFLVTNGAILELSNSELVTLFMDIAEGSMSRDEVEQLLRMRTTEVAWRRESAARICPTNFSASI
jgi:death-on-curing protein